MSGVAVTGPAAVALFAALTLCAACSSERDGNDVPLGSPPVLESVEVDIVLPGTTGTIRGAVFFEHGIYLGRIVGDVSGVAVDREVPLRFIDSGRLALLFEPGFVAEVPEGQLVGIVEVSAEVEGLHAAASVAIQARVMNSMEPRLDSIAGDVFPASPVQVIGGGFIAGDGGRTVVELRATYTHDDGRQTTFEQSGIATPPEGSTSRDEVSFLFDASWVGIEPGHIEGEVRVVNEGRGWFAEGEWTMVTLDLLPPTIERLSTESASRGEAVRILGNGFLGGDAGGTTTLRLGGDFLPPGGQAVPIDGVELNPEWESGTRLVFSFRVHYEPDCESDDLGATPGRIDGTVTPVISLDGQTVEGEASVLVFDILPTKQVVHLDFLPAFTDSLRLFGLRNVSREVKARVLKVIRRDYAGINLEIREVEPTDWLDYSIVQIGGPDPNGSRLFGLDNTPDLDHCNQRLDDYLAGRNADSQGYGGIFVESFLQLSPSIPGNQNPLTHEAFDEIFESVMDEEVERDEYPDGPRAEVIERAIRTLGNLVANTATHEIGHSLGLPQAPGDDRFHNTPGDRQIMDPGRDRPFEERAELEGVHAEWTLENRRYLAEILPLP